MTTAAEMAEIIAHETGHVTEDISRGDFSLESAAPFLTREQFDTMGYEGELRAYRNELDVLRDLMKHDPDDQPCIQALIDEHPVLHALDHGDETAARRAIKSGYQQGYDDYYSSLHRADAQKDIAPIVQKYLSTPDYQSAQAAWRPIGSQYALRPGKVAFVRVAQAVNAVFQCTRDTSLGHQWPEDERTGHEWPPRPCGRAGPALTGF